MANAKVIISAQSELDKGLNKAKSQLQDFEKAAGTIGNSISSMISKHAGIAALVGSVAALGTAAKKCADEYLGAARENDRFAATMKNLTKTTGVTASEVQSLADKYEILTFHTAEQIQAASQLLLATGEISKDAFPRALEATMDLAEAMGQDLSSAASSLQKALAEPESGLKALRTAGINFTDAEEDLITSLIESNKKLEAQDLILQKIEERYAGVAKAVGDTPAGKLDAIKETWGAIKEGIGEHVIESLDGVFSFILEKLTKIREAMEEPVEFKTVMQRATEEGKITNDSDYTTLLQTQKDIALVRQAGKDKNSVTPKDLQAAVNRLEKIYGVDAGQSFSSFNQEEEFKIAELLADYEKENPSVLLLTNSVDELKKLYNQLAIEEANRQKMLEVMIERGVASGSTIDNFSVVNPIFTYLDQFFKGSGNGGEDSGLPDALSDASSYIENFIEDAFVSTLDSYGKEIYDINKQIVELQSVEIDPKYRAEVDKLISDLIELGDSVVAKRAEAEAKEEAEKEAKKTADSIRESLKGLSGTEEEVYSLYQILDEIVKSGDEGLMSLFGTVTSKIAEIYDAIDAEAIQKRKEEEENLLFVQNSIISAQAAQAERQKELQRLAAEAMDEYLAKLEEQKRLTEEAAKDNNLFVENAIISAQAAQAERLKQLQAEAKAAMDAHKAAKAEEEVEAKSKQVKDITSDIGPAETEEDIYELFIALDELAKIGTEEASEVMVRISEYIADFYDDLDAAEIERKKIASNIWDDKGFRGMEEIFETLGEEMSLDDVFGGFFAEFGRTRAFDFGEFLGPLETLLDALDPLLDIVLSSTPVMAIFVKILEAAAEVIGSAISTTIAPFFDFLDEFGTLLGEVFLPIFDSLYPVINMITEMLRMFFVPVLQFLEPIINTLATAFDYLAGIVAVVGAVLTPVAATIEFVMDIFGYFGELMLTVGENIGIAFHNMTHWLDQREFKEKPEFHSDAFDNLGEKMDKWFTMMEDDQVVSDSVSQQIATTNATYTGATTVHMNIYQNAPVVGENGMEQFAIMIRDKFEELNYFAA